MTHKATLLNHHQMSHENPTGIAFALAWPKTYCKKAGSWYDVVLKKLGVSSKGFYQVGHAAIVLVEKSTGVCHYFDFGRYHAPFGHGRVRSATTDPELTINTTAVFDAKRKNILNIQAILKELSQRAACHGQGTLIASSCEIDFQKGLQKAIAIQKQSPLPYGPFIKQGTNCSRFVHRILMSCCTHQWIKFRLYFPIIITPSPMTNVRALSNRLKIIKEENLVIPVISSFATVLLPPEKHRLIPAEAQWYAGEGAGSWFWIIQLSNEKQHYAITRFDEAGNIEFKAVFCTQSVFHPILHFTLEYPSHYKTITLTQRKERIVLSRVDSNSLKKIGNSANKTSQKAAQLI